MRKIVTFLLLICTRIKTIDVYWAETLRTNKGKGFRERVGVDVGFGEEVGQTDKRQGFKRRALSYSKYTLLHYLQANNIVGNISSKNIFPVLKKKNSN